MSRSSDPIDVAPSVDATEKIRTPQDRQETAAAVLAWHASGARARDIAAGLPALAAPITTLRDARLVQGTTAALLVALDAGPDGQIQLPDECAPLMDCAAAGTAIIGVGRGLSRLPLPERCRLLLAGIREVIDDGLADWHQQLMALVGPLVDRRRQEQSEDIQAQQLMERIGIVARSPIMRPVARTLLRAARVTDLSVMLTGETGVGKEMAARAVHAADPRRAAKPLVAVNCAAVSKPLAESELFGHRRGAFSGADRDRHGLFRAAHEGILFLDEVGDLDLGLQAKLLRVLQEGRVRAVGDDNDVVVDVRVVAASHRDLPAMVSAGLFRSDLFHRLCAVTIRLPALRERRGDLPALVEHLTQKHRALAGVGQLRISPEFIAALAALELPGNIRELENIVRSAMILARNEGTLSLCHLPPDAWREIAAATSAEPPASSPSAAEQSPPIHRDDGDWNLALAVDRFERRYIDEALLRTGGSHAEAAKLLGVTPRTIYNKLRKYGPAAPPPPAAP